MACVDAKQQAADRQPEETAGSDEKTPDVTRAIEKKKRDYRILPVDESGSDPSLLAFIDHLRKIVSVRDTSALFRALDSSVVVSHGGGMYGVKDFSETWELNTPERSELWKVLKRILNMGGTWEDKDGRCFCIPYTHSDKAFRQFEHEFDWYFTAVCVSSGVKVYQEPDTQATEKAVLQYDIVEMDPDFMKKDFTKIRTIDQNIQGYVLTGDLIYSADHCLILRKTGDNWKITGFAPFD